jgi:hypothetical protein
MSLAEKINQELKEAMKAKDEARKRTLRAIKAQLLLLKTSGATVEIGETQEIKLLQKMIKERQDSFDIYNQQGREDLAKNEKEELEIIQAFLPAQMSEAELEDYLKSLIQQLGASSMKDMGKVMGAANKNLAGKADGRMISIAVKKLLA